MVNSEILTIRLSQTDMSIYPL